MVFDHGPKKQAQSHPKRGIIATIILKTTLPFQFHNFKNFEPRQQIRTQMHEKYAQKLEKKGSKNFAQKWVKQGLFHTSLLL